MIVKNNPNIDEQVLELKMIVAGHNGNGEPDLYFCKVRCERRDYNDGEHYAIAERAAVRYGFLGHLISFDEHDSAGRNMLPLFVWESASVYKA